MMSDQYNLLEIQIDIQYSDKEPKWRLINPVNPVTVVFTSIQYYGKYHNQYDSKITLCTSHFLKSQTKSFGEQIWRLISGISHQTGTVCEFLSMKGPKHIRHIK